MGGASSSDLSHRHAAKSHIRNCLNTKSYEIVEGAKYLPYFTDRFRKHRGWGFSLHNYEERERGKPVQYKALFSTFQCTYVRGDLVFTYRDKRTVLKIDKERLYQYEI
jgi:hypothetical protein